MNIIDKIMYGGRGKFTVLESFLFSELIKVAPDEFAEVFQLQMSNVRMIQDFHDYKIIGYHLKKDFNTLLPDETLDLCYAKFNFVINEKKFFSKLYVSAGKISSLQTRKGFDKLDFRSVPTRCKCEIMSSVDRSLMDEIDFEEHGCVK